MRKFPTIEELNRQLAEAECEMYDLPFTGPTTNDYASLFDTADCSYEVPDGGNYVPVMPNLIKDGELLLWQLIPLDLETSEAFSYIVVPSAAGLVVRKTYRAGMGSYHCCRHSELHSQQVDKRFQDVMAGMNW